MPKYFYIILTISVLVTLAAMAQSSIGRRNFEACVAGGGGVQACYAKYLR